MGVARYAGMLMAGEGVARESGRIGGDELELLFKE
jgi:hypothetical protein